MSSITDQNENEAAEIKPGVGFENPKWLTAELFENVLNEYIPKFRKITRFEAKPALAAGENYATVMLRIHIDFELTDTLTDSISLMMKLPQENKILQDMMRKHNIFEIEYKMYHEVLPEFKKMYLSAGVNAMFSANCYNIDTPSEFGVILLEDLRPLGYKNANRLEGLNLEHTKAVLERLSQWHAASAARVETKGIYPEIIAKGMFSETQRETMENFSATIKPQFLSSIKTIEGSEDYMDDLVNVLHNITDLLFSTSKYDPNEFNVLNHGDCWSNNIMFKYDEEGKIVDAVLIDYQMVNYGSPAKDLLYFLLSSTAYDLKVKEFNYLIKFYHENLTKNLTILKYPKKLPSLKEIHCAIIKYGIWGLSTSFGVMAAALLESNHDANIDSFINDSDAGERFRNLMFSNPRYRKHLEIVMPWMSNRGVFEVMTMTNTPNGNAENDVGKLPEWLEAVTFENAARTHIGEDFGKIVNARFESDPSSKANYSSLLLRLHLDVELTDGSIKTVTFVLKAPHSNEIMSKIINLLKLFPKEEKMYHSIIPKFETLYTQVGSDIKFAPNAYQFDRDIGVDYILLEDLRPRGYKNANRIKGLDLEHTKHVLQKLAEFHAASACYVEHFGMFPEEFTVGFYSKNNTELLKQFNSSSAFLAQLKKWKNGQAFYEKLADSDSYLVDRLLQDQTYNPSEFNVLNHGDCWVNNILFKYNAFGKITDTRFIDFQVGKYGSPANDLYYFILSSTAADIKIAHFDYLVRYYFDNLVENLKLLQYHRPLPKLRNLHSVLLKHGLTAYLVVSKILPVVMLEKSGDETNRNGTQDEDKLKFAMYTNPKYVESVSEILPWLDNRGLLDWKV
ncbi:uncharacterized protein [Bactrocera oleae]|uniref:uncharacterized protein n=1 Tax=Bactrocera oleae TaxID=104688 RepID=UPI00387EC4ED